MGLVSALGLGAWLAVSVATSVVASDVIRAGDRITSANTVVEGEPGDGSADDLLGREARRTIYAGQPVSMDNTRPARLVLRNQVVTLRYLSGGLEISTTGRAMGEAALNEPVSVLNLQSKQLVQGIVQESGWVLVQ